MTNVRENPNVHKFLQDHHNNQSMSFKSLGILPGKINSVKKRWTYSSIFIFFCFLFMHLVLKSICIRFRKKISLKFHRKKMDATQVCVFQFIEIFQMA
jgi:hypothetical protein